MNATTEITRYRARYVLDRFDFVEGAAVDVQDGRVVAFHRDGAAREAATTVPVHEVDLGEVALVPGLINAHSHAFQRAIRGRTEYADPTRPEDDFWTWREQMYGAALTFSPEQFEAVSALAFLEMALSGITTVGEFHYVHHQPDGTPYDDPNELARRVIAAADAVGIRISLLRVAYHRAGFEKAPDPMQRRFLEPDVDTYLARLEALRDHFRASERVHVGLAPHSIRAVPKAWLTAIAEYGASSDLPIHIHACEQQAEIEQSRREYGKTPVEVFADLGLLDKRVTLVHGTHLSDNDLDLLEAHRPTVCACPTTERNLGDGFLPARRLLEHNVPVSLGSDSHTVIDLWEEMRLVEYHERLRTERRNVLAPFVRTQRLCETAPDRLETARVLWPMGGLHGARSLRLPAGCLETGCYADFVALDLSHISLVGATADNLLAHLTLSAPPGAVRDVFVAGEAIIRQRRHQRQEAIIDGFCRALAAR